MTKPAPAPPASAPPSLVSVLGDSRAAIVGYLRREGEASVAQLASHLEVSEVATRRHLAVLQEDGLVATRRVPQARGRPASHYRLTPAAHRLFPQRYDHFAAEALDFLTDEHGRDGLRAFLRWRLEREVAGLQEAVTAPDLAGRLEQLAEALSAAGFEASVAPSPDGDGYTLVQDHCALEGVAREHPELCAYEAATFAKVLGREATLSRRETLATGARACVCSVTARSTRPAAADQRQGDAAPTDQATAPVSSTPSRSSTPPDPTTPPEGASR